jgi:hypothetical protein
MVDAAYAEVMTGNREQVTTRQVEAIYEAALTSEGR